MTAPAAPRGTDPRVEALSRAIAQAMGGVPGEYLWTAHQYIDRTEAAGLLVLDLKDEALVERMVAMLTLWVGGPVTAATLTDRVLGVIRWAGRSERFEPDSGDPS